MMCQFMWQKKPEGKGGSAAEKCNKHRSFAARKPKSIVLCRSSLIHGIMRQNNQSDRAPVEAGTFFPKSLPPPSMIAMLGGGSLGYLYFVKDDFQRIVDVLD